MCVFLSHSLERSKKFDFPRGCIQDLDRLIMQINQSIDMFYTLDRTFKIFTFKNWLSFTAMLLLLACSDEYNNMEPVGSQRYIETVFTSMQVEQDVSYGQASTQGGVVQDLKMDIYQPEGDTLGARPLVILVHGGGFTGGNKDQFIELSRLLALSGYVSASISYRLIDTERTETSLRQGILEAVHDARASIRFFKKDAAQNNVYRIDTNAIFLGGFSAGGFTALHAAYVNNVSDIESLGGSALVDYAQNNGGIEGNSGNPGFSSSFKGVINIAGALVSTDFISAQDPILISFHGTDDGIVPYLEGEADGSGVITRGSGLIHPVLAQLGIINQLYPIEGGDHGAFFSCETCETDLRRFLQANF